MKGLRLGSIVMLAVVSYALYGQDLSVFLNSHAIVIVVFGTVAVLLLSSPPSNIKTMFATLFRSKKDEHDLAQVNRDLIALAKNKSAKINSSHPLLEAAQDLWDQGTERKLFRYFVSQKVQDLNGQTHDAVATLRNLAKYPPALGMTGTVIGLVLLFSKLNPESKSQIGPALALAMTATFYGLILANAVLMPLADRLHLHHLNREKTNAHIFHLLVLINEDEPISLAEGELKNAG